MTASQLDPAQEKEILHVSIDTLHQQWGKAEMAQAYTDLVAAVARAEQAPSPCCNRCPSQAAWPFGSMSLAWDV